MDPTTGAIKLSALTEILDGVPSSFSGEGRVASFSLQPIQSGVTTIEITPASTVAETGNNILTEINNLELTIVSNEN